MEMKQKVRDNPLPFHQVERFTGAEHSIKVDHCIKIQLARHQVMWTESLQKPWNEGYTWTNSAEKVSNSDMEPTIQNNSMEKPRLRKNQKAVHKYVETTPQGQTTKRLRWKKDDWTSLDISRNLICRWTATPHFKLLRIRVYGKWITA